MNPGLLLARRRRRRRRDAAAARDRQRVLPAVRQHRRSLAVLRNQAPPSTRDRAGCLGRACSIAAVHDQNIVLNASAAALLPGKGLKQLYDANGSAAPYSVLVNLVLTFLTAKPARSSRHPGRTHVRLLERWHLPAGRCRDGGAAGRDRRPGVRQRRRKAGRATYAMHRRRRKADRGRRRPQVGGLHHLPHGHRPPDDARERRRDPGLHRLPRRRRREDQAARPAARRPGVHRRARRRRTCCRAIPRPGSARRAPTPSAATRCSIARAREFVRFVNPATCAWRARPAAPATCRRSRRPSAACMTTSAMLWGGAAYNNGILPYKRYVLGEAYDARRASPRPS